jgi:hypothetical protein
MFTQKIKFLIITLVIVSLSIFFTYKHGRSIWYPYYSKVVGKKTVSGVIANIRERTESQLQSDFLNVNFPYPPDRVSLIAIKDVNILELWGHSGDRSKKIKTYPILAASGQLGPKLIEGDRQVPEGIYDIVSFNPNSSYHLSMKLNYPNNFDLKYAKQEGRQYPGTNIFIHGKSASIGCLAMGDRVIEELFTLVHNAKRNKVTVVISPNDPEFGPLLSNDISRPWISELYKEITQKINTIRSFQ